MSVPSFDINVFQKPFPVTRLKLVVSLESEATAGAPVIFQITDPVGTARSTPAMSTGFGSSGLLDFNPAPPGAVDFDGVEVFAPDGGLAAGDPALRRYVFIFSLLSDYNPGNNCNSTMAGNETWQVAVTSGPEFTSACPISFDSQVFGAECGVDLRVVPLTEAVAEIDTFGEQGHSCEEYRPPLDVVLVLDKSGSMGGSTTGAGGTKIVALRNALTDFVTIWADLRTTEPSYSPPLITTDNIGVALFEGNADWWATIGFGLHNFDATQATILANVNTITHGGSTSIGDGLLLADGVLNAADPTRRRVILLMSDGMQNTDDMVGVTADETQVYTYQKATPGVTTTVPHQANYQIYTVTVGPSAGVSAEVKYGLANATNGFYINTEDDADQLSPFFLELLQNFIRFNTWQTARLIHDTVTIGKPYQVSIPISTTTQHVSFALRWPDGMGFMRMHVTPSGESQPVVESGNRTIVMNFDVPTSQAYTYLDEWLVVIELADPSGHISQIPFDLVVLVDDVALDVDMNVAPQRYAPGDSVQLEARVHLLEQPVTTLGDQSDDKLLVQVVKPGTSIGDLLSTSSASANQPFEGDSITDANAKLYNELQENPSALVRDDSDLITLTHAGDGLYRGTYQVQAAGHYNFLFGIEGQTGGKGRFSRMQIKTIHVRPLPDPNATNFQTEIRQTKDGNRLMINMTPRTVFNNLVGPGWATHFWFTAPNIRPERPRDNLDGTYSASIPFSGPLPPDVAVHFLDIPMFIDESVSGDNLPVPLDDSNVLKPSIAPCGCLCQIIRFFRWILSLF